MKKEILDLIQTCQSEVAFILNSRDIDLSEERLVNLRRIETNLIEHSKYVNEHVNEDDVDKLIEYEVYLQNLSSDLEAVYMDAPSAHDDEMGDFDDVEDIDDLEEDDEMDDFDDMHEDDDEIDDIDDLDEDDEMDDENEDDDELEDEDDAVLVEETIPEDEQDEETIARRESIKKKIKNGLIIGGVVGALIITAASVRSCQNREIADLAEKKRYESELEELQRQLDEAKKEAENAKETPIPGATVIEEPEETITPEEPKEEVEVIEAQTVEVLSIDDVDLNNPDSIYDYATKLKEENNIDLSVDEIVDAIYLVNINKFPIYDENGEIAGYNNIEHFDTLENTYNTIENVGKLTSTVPNGILQKTTEDGISLEKTELERIVNRMSDNALSINDFEEAKLNESQYDFIKVFDRAVKGIKAKDANSTYYSQIFNELVTETVHDAHLETSTGFRFYIMGLYNENLQNTAEYTVGYWRSIIYGEAYDENGNKIDPDGLGGHICAEELYKCIGLYENYERVSEHEFYVDRTDVNEDGLPYLFASDLEQLNAMNRSR